MPEGYSLVGFHGVMSRYANHHSDSEDSGDASDQKDLADQEDVQVQLTRIGIILAKHTN